MRELPWRQKPQLLRPEPLHVTAQRRHAEHEKQTTAKTAATSQKEQKETARLDTLRQQIEQVEATTARFVNLWSRYNQTPGPESMRTLYDNVSGFSEERDREYPNRLKKTQEHGTQEEDDGTAHDWVGERVSWVWYDTSYPLRIVEREHGVWIPRKGKPFKYKLVRKVEYGKPVERTVTLRLYDNNRLEIIGKEEIVFDLEGKSSNAIEQWLDEELGNAMVDPKKTVIQSGY